MTVLEDIQRLQYGDPEAANGLLRDFVREVFDLDVSEVTLRPLAVSLNSFNGFLTLADGRRLFFKSHVEPGNVIAEYYNTDLLLKAGYSVIAPVYASTTPGRQMLIYEVVDDASVFDVAWEIENGRSGDLEKLRAAQNTADDDLCRIHGTSLAWQSADDHARAPIHQLFHHRLTRGRFDTFYEMGTSIVLPELGALPMAEVRRAAWTINGVTFKDTLDDIIARAINLLEPAQDGPAAVGHGDAHNGNVFLRGESLVYFDPAFAGRHDPLLDLTKPLYHNVFAMWMYFPRETAEGGRGATLGSVGIHSDVTTLKVAYPSHLSPIRRMFWESKTERVLIPTLRLLRQRGWLRSDWQSYLQSSLACCPLLTMNLADGSRFPPPVALLGLAHVMEMGGRTVDGSSRVECWLNEVESAL